VATLCLLAANNHAQPSAAGRAPKGFTSVQYYDPPNQMQLRSRLSGAEAQPLTGGLLFVKGLKLEMFGTNGLPQVIVNAPECIYDTHAYTANSSGRLLLENGDGKIRVEGNGFLWRQKDAFLTISNEVRTTVESDFKNKIAP
jgi:hypothetical protein